MYEEGENEEYEWKSLLSVEDARTKYELDDTLPYGCEVGTPHYVRRQSGAVKIQLCKGW